MFFVVSNPLDLRPAPVQRPGGRGITLLIRVHVPEEQMDDRQHNLQSGRFHQNEYIALFAGPFDGVHNKVRRPRNN